MPKLIQIMAWHDFLIGLDDKGRLWEIYPRHNTIEISISLMVQGDLPE